MIIKFTIFPFILITLPLNFLCVSVIEIASGDYGDQWISILGKATALSSDSDSSGLANDCSDGASEGMEDRSITPPGKAKAYKPELIENGSSYDKEVAVTLIDSESDPKYIMKSVHDDSRIGLFSNQFFTLLKRSFLCVSRDMVRS